MQRFTWTALVMTFTLVTVSACTAASSQHPAEAVVEEMYVALAADDMDAYMDTILPKNRRTPNPVLLLKGLSIYGGAGGVQVGFDLKALSAISLRDTQFTVVETEGDYALVQAEGVVRYPALAWEVPFCDQHDVRRVDGQWYVDVYAPEREARVQLALEQRLQELEANPQEGEELAGLLQDVGEVSEIMFNLCPR